MLALLAALLLTTPGRADPADGSGLVTLAAATPPLIKPGQTIPLAVGVWNTGGSAVDGIVVNIGVGGGIGLPQSFANCRYYRDGILGGAWCSLSGRVGPGARYALPGFRVTASATAQRLSPVTFHWYPASWAERQGGIAALAGGGVAGSGGALSLGPTSLAGPAVNAVYLKLVTSTDTPRPARSTSAAGGAPPGSEPAGGETESAAGGAPTESELAGGETGSRTVTNLILLVGGALLLIGGAAAALFARGRTSYTGRHS